MRCARLGSPPPRGPVSPSGTTGASPEAQLRRSRRYGSERVRSLLGVLRADQGDLKREPRALLQVRLPMGRPPHRDRAGQWASTSRRVAANADLVGESFGVGDRGARRAPGRSRSRHRRGGATRRTVIPPREPRVEARAGRLTATPSPVTRGGAAGRRRGSGRPPGVSTGRISTACSRAQIGQF